MHVEQGGGNSPLSSLRGCIPLDLAKQGKYPESLAYRIYKYSLFSLMEVGELNIGRRYPI